MRFAGPATLLRRAVPTRSPAKALGAARPATDALHLVDGDAATVGGSLSDLLSSADPVIAHFDSSPPVRALGLFRRNYPCRQTSVHDLGTHMAHFAARRSCWCLGAVVDILSAELMKAKAAIPAQQQGSPSS
jgi:hypothetical protein